MSDTFHPGELFVYTNGNRWELGMVKRPNNTGDGYFCWYSRGDTAANTPTCHMHKLANAGFTHIEQLLDNAIPTPAQAIAATVGNVGYGMCFAPTFDRPPETMVGETVFDSEGNAIGWITNATVGRETLTAEQVRECAKGVYFEGYSDGATHRVNGIKETDWQTIADKLNATVGRRDTMELWPEWEQVLFANVSDEVAQDNLNECVHELLDKAATVSNRSCASCPEMDNPDSYISHLHRALEVADSGAGTCHNVGDKRDFCCSECGVRMFIESDDTYTMIASDERTIIKRPNFCPNCGKRVDR